MRHRHSIPYRPAPRPVAPFVDELKSELAGNACAGHVRPVVMDLDVTDVGLGKRAIGEKPGRRGRESASREARVNPISDLESVRCDPAVQPATPDHLVEKEDAEKDVTALTSVAFPLLKPGPAVLDGCRLLRDPAHLRSEMVDALGDCVAERLSIFRRPATQQEPVRATDSLWKHGPRSSHVGKLTQRISTSPSRAL